MICFQCMGCGKQEWIMRWTVAEVVRGHIELPRPWVRGYLDRKGHYYLYCTNACWLLDNTDAPRGAEGG